MGILRRKMGSWSLSPSLLTSAVHIIIVIVKIIIGGGGETYNNKIVESNLRKPVRQLITSHFFWFV
jgi:hypothetical protein